MEKGKGKAPGWHGAGDTPAFGLWAPTSKGEWKEIRRRNDLELARLGRPPVVNVPLEGPAPSFEEIERLKVDKNNHMQHILSSVGSNLSGGKGGDTTAGKGSHTGAATADGKGKGCGKAFEKGRVEGDQKGLAVKGDGKDGKGPIDGKGAWSDGTNASKGDVSKGGGKDDVKGYVSKGGGGGKDAVWNVTKGGIDGASQWDVSKGGGKAGYDGASKGDVSKGGGKAGYDGASKGDVSKGGGKAGYDGPSKGDTPKGGGKAGYDGASKGGKAGYGGASKGDTPNGGGKAGHDGASEGDVSKSGGKAGYDGASQWDVSKGGGKDGTSKGDVSKGGGKAGKDGMVSKGKDGKGYGKVFTARKGKGGKDGGNAATVQASHEGGKDGAGSKGCAGKGGGAAERRDLLLQQFANLGDEEMCAMIEDAKKHPRFPHYVDAKKQEYGDEDWSFDDCEMPDELVSWTLFRDSVSEKGNEKGGKPSGSFTSCKEEQDTFCPKHPVVLIYVLNTQYKCVYKVTYSYKSITFRGKNNFKPPCVLRMVLQSMLNWRQPMIDFRRLQVQRLLPVPPYLVPIRLLLSS